MNKSLKQIEEENRKAIIMASHPECRVYRPSRGRVCFSDWRKDRVVGHFESLVKHTFKNDK